MLRGLGDLSRVYMKQVELSLGHKDVPNYGEATIYYLHFRTYFIVIIILRHALYSNLICKYDIFVCGEVR